MGSLESLLHALLASRAAATFDLGFHVSAVHARHFLPSRSVRPVLCSTEQLFLSLLGASGDSRR